MSKAPIMTGYFRSRIDIHVNGAFAQSQASRYPTGVKRIIGDVTDPRIVVVMEDGTEYVYSGGRYASVKRNGCYAPLLPRLVKEDKGIKYEPGHSEHTDDCMSEWSEARRYTLPLDEQTIAANHMLHMWDVENPEGRGESGYDLK